MCHLCDCCVFRPFDFQVLPIPDASEQEKNKAVNVSGHDMAEICAGVPQTLLIGCSDSGEAPEIVALVKPDGAH